MRKYAFPKGIFPTNKRIFCFSNKGIIPDTFVVDMSDRACSEWNFLSGDMVFNGKEKLVLIGIVDEDVPGSKIAVHIKGQNILKIAGIDVCGFEKIGRVKLKF